MKYCIKKILKALNLYYIMCRIFLPKRKFIIQPFVYINKHNKIVKNEITDTIEWLENFEIETQCIEFAESAFWKEAKKKYSFYDTIWIFKY